MKGGAALGAQREFDDAERSLVLLVPIRLYRDAIRTFLREHGVRVVAAVDSWEASLEAIRVSGARIVVADMATGPVLEHLRGGVIAADIGRFDIIALAPPDGTLVACIQAGVRAYVTRDAALPELIAAVDGVARGQPAVPQEVAAQILRHLSRSSRRPTKEERLTAREREVVSLVRSGLSNKEIAEHLQLGVSTVKSHVHNVLVKLGARRRIDLGWVTHDLAPSGDAPAPRAAVPRAIPPRI